MNELPPPIDLPAEWSALAAAYAGHLDAAGLDLSLFTAERKITLARVRAGTVAEWEADVFDRCPALSAEDYARQVDWLRELSRRRSLLLAADKLVGLHVDAMTADEACEILARAAEANR